MALASIPTREQDTVICFGRDEPFAIIDTSDRTMITKLEKKVKESECYTLEEIHTMEGGLECGRKYKVSDKTLISFRSRKTTLNLTDEQRKALSERAKVNMHS